MVVPASVLERVRRIDELLILKQQRMVPPSKRGEWFFLRQSSYHEAGHVVACKALGVPVTSAEVRTDGTGVTKFANGTDMENLVITVAGDMAVDLFASDYMRDGYVPGFSDRCHRAKHDEFSLREARRIAFDLLMRYRPEWGQIADELEEKRYVRYSAPLATPPKYSSYVPRA